VLAVTAVRARASRAVDALVRNGTTAARVQVDVDAELGLVLAHLHLLLAEQNAGRCHLQLVAFPRGGLETRADVDVLTAALEAGLPVVGGRPSVAADPAQHLDVVFRLAERYGVPLDLHLDAGREPGRAVLELVADRTRAHGMAGRVTISHVTSLGSTDPLTRSRVFETLAGAGIALVSLPMTDLPSGVAGEPAPVFQALAAGVRVAVANSVIASPVAPFGNASLVQAAWLSGVLGQATTEQQQRQLLDMITATPAGILGLPIRGPVPGAVADLVVLDADDPTLVLRTAPAVSATISGGRLVHLAEPPSLRAG
jgi:cytosine deaminase